MTDVACCMRTVHALEAIWEKAGLHGLSKYVCECVCLVHVCIIVLTHIWLKHHYICNVAAAVPVIMCIYGL